MIRGRVVALEGRTVQIASEAGGRAVSLEEDGDAVGVGDLVEVDAAGRARVLVRARRPDTTWARRVLDPRRLRAMAVRDVVENAIREFFRSRGFREVRTPLLVPNPGMEPHLRPFRVSNGAYLPTSPEFAMKRLLVGGLERIFQLGPAFRDEPRSATHHPEFTMLEWYRAYAGWEEIQRDTEELFAFVAHRLSGRPALTFRGREISFSPPWPRLRVRDLFREHVGVDLGHEPLDDARFFQLWLDVVEPRLPADRAVFVTHWPASQAALAVVEEHPDGTRWARRFEAYAGGLELANAFEELTDPVEQRRRFEADMALRARTYGPDFPQTPLPEGFLAALEEGLPPSGGIALGVDRMVMLFADEPEIEYTLWMPSVDH